MKTKILFFQIINPKGKQKKKSTKWDQFIIFFIFNKLTLLKRNVEDIFLTKYIYAYVYI